MCVTPASCILSHTSLILSRLLPLSSPLSISLPPLLRVYLEQEIALSPEQISKYVEKVQLYLNYTLKELRRLFLVQDLIDSLKVRWSHDLINLPIGRFHHSTVRRFTNNSHLSHFLWHNEHSKYVISNPGLSELTNSLITLMLVHTLSTYRCVCVCSSQCWCGCWHTLALCLTASLFSFWVRKHTIHLYTLHTQPRTLWVKTHTHTQFRSRLLWPNMYILMTFSVTGLSGVTRVCVFSFSLSPQLWCVCSPCRLCTRNIRYDII